MEQDYTFLVIMAVIALIGMIAAIIYYFARYSFKTDYDRDQERLAREIPDTSEAHRLTEAIATAPQPSKVPAAEEGEEQIAKEILEKRKEQELEDQRTKDQARELHVVRPEPERKSLSEALNNTRENIFGRIRSMFGNQALSESDMEAIEEVLYTSDLGPATVQRLMETVAAQLKGNEASSVEKVRSALKNEMNRIFKDLPQPLDSSSLESWLDRVDKTQGPHVILVVGVNGAGKTTSIGKLAHWFASHQRRTLVAAGDTFRAAAGDQLRVWSERAQVEIFSPAGVSDPSAVAFDACQKAKAKEFKVVIIDTAGRLHTQAHLMEELKKMRRVITKVLPEAPHETLLVLDSNSGQNALIQARQFNEALEVSGVILTKLDGTAKGGVAVGIANELRIPIQLVGVGEGLEDLRAFNSSEFVDSVI